MIFFTADEYYGHANIIKYCNRPFKSVQEMDEEIIKRHNSVVKHDDQVIHAGDFSIYSELEFVQRLYTNKLSGHHIFLMGSHDKWLPKNTPMILEKEIEGQLIVVCHYAMRTWRKSHYNSWQIYGHSHGKLTPQGKQWDAGVDNNNFYPISFEGLKEIMKMRPDNFNLVRN
jgi:calcineurin-like phosphoesterase family protein